MRVSARADYALRACIELARAADSTPTSDVIAQAQGISQQFVQRILGDLRHAGYVDATRARGGGYRLASAPDQVTVADIVRALDGPLFRVHGVDPDELRYPDSAAHLVTTWTVVRACLETLLDGVTLSDLATGRLPDPVPGLLPLFRRWGAESLRAG